MNLFELPVDQYQRYRIAADAINALRGDCGKLKILEVGGYPPRLGEFLPDDDILMIDLVEMSEKPTGHAAYMLADGLNLQFEDKSFDAVISLDVLEHIEPQKREKFVLEQIRLAKDYVVLASPFGDEKGTISHAESLLFEFIKESHGYTHKYFDEHLKYSLPTIGYIKQLFAERAWETHVLPNGYFFNWFLTILIEYSAEFNVTLKGILPKLREYYNYNFYKNDNRESAYRHVIVASRNGFEDPEEKALTNLESSQPPGEFPPVEYAASLIELARINAQSAFLNQVEGLKHDLSARDDEIAHLKKYVAELEDFNNKIKSTLPYQIYERLVKKQK